MTRRTFLLVPIALAAQPVATVEVVWIKETTVPEEFARESVVFPRAYTCRPQFSPAHEPLETGRFPHAPGGMRILSLIPAEITIVTADAGDDEESPFEHSIRVPLAIRWPRKLAPRVADDILISHADVLPTVLAWAGRAIPGDLPGRDLSALIARHEGETPDSIYVEGKLGQKDEWRVVVRGFDKIVFNLQEEVTHLFNLADDPFELTNLAHDPAQKLKLASLKAQLQAQMKKLSDGMDPSGLRRR